MISGTDAGPYIFLAYLLGVGIITLYIGLCLYQRQKLLCLLGAISESK